jgi:predicted type IV restriction endonuclease
VSDIVLSAPLAVVLSLDEPGKVIHAIENGLVTVEASEYNRTQLLVALQALSQERIDTLIERCYGFLKLTPKPRLDLKTVTLSELVTPKDVDFVRDEAVKREKTDLTEALRLMELAHQARPNGPFIKKKVQEYRKALGD